MTKAAYSAHLRSSPHLDCNETYLSHPLISHLLQLLSGNLTVSVQSCLTFDRKPNGSGPSGGRLENHSLCDDALDRRGGRRDREEKGGEISVFLFEMVNEIVLCRCPAQNTCKGSSLRAHPCYT